MLPDYPIILMEESLYEIDVSDDSHYTYTGLATAGTVLTLLIPISSNTGTGAVFRDAPTLSGQQ